MTEKNKKYQTRLFLACFCASLLTLIACSGSSEQTYQDARIKLVSITRTKEWVQIGVRATPEQKGFEIAVVRLEIRGDPGKKIKLQSTDIDLTDDQDKKYNVGGGSSDLEFIEGAKPILMDLAFIIPENAHLKQLRVGSAGFNVN